MKVWTIDYLDPGNYSMPDPTDVEEHASMRAARDSFWQLCDGERFGNEHEHQRYVYFYAPTDPDGKLDSTDQYPDRIMTLGPRGGVRVEHC